MVDLTNTKLIETGLKSNERDTRGLFRSNTRTKNWGTGGDDTVVVNKSFCQSLGVESIDQTGKWNSSYPSAQTSSQLQ